MMPTAHYDPWERLDREGDEAWEAFMLYRGMGLKRSTSKVSQQLGKTRALICRWSSEHRWVHRCLAYEREQDRIAVAETKAEVAELARRNAKLAMAMQAKLAGRLKELDVRDVPVEQLPAFMRAVTDALRCAVGQQVKLTGADGGPIEINDTSKERLASLLGAVVDACEETGVDSEPQ